MHIFSNKMYMIVCTKMLTSKLRNVTTILIFFRYDKEGTGALHANNFFRLSGLDPKGRPRQAAPYTPRGAAYPLPRPHSEIAHTNGVLDKPANLKNLLKGAKSNTETSKADSAKADVVENKTKGPINVPVATTEEKETELNVDSGETKDTQEPTKDTVSKEEASKIEKIKKPKAPPKLDNIIDCLHYKVRMVRIFIFWL